MHNLYIKLLYLTYTMPEDTMGMNWGNMYDESECPLSQAMILKNRALKPGRLLQNPTPQVDPATQRQYHSYRKILAYDRVSEVVKISREGSALNPQALDEVDEEVLANALYSSELSQYFIRSEDWDINK